MSTEEYREALLTDCIFAARALRTLNPDARGALAKVPCDVLTRVIDLLDDVTKELSPDKAD